MAVARAARVQSVGQRGLRSAGVAEGESLARFLAERQQSLRWLRGLVAPDWSYTCLLPSGQHIRAGDLLAAWVTHDLLHLRQLVAVQYHAHAYAVAPYHVAYAGDW